MSFSLLKIFILALSVFTPYFLPKSLKVPTGLLVILFLYCPYFELILIYYSSGNKQCFPVSLLSSISELCYNDAKGDRESFM